MSRKNAMKKLSERENARRLENLNDWHDHRSRLNREHAITRGVAVSCLQVLQRGFWGRLKWLLFGR